MSNRIIHLSYFNDRYDRLPVVKSLSWRDFCHSLYQPVLLSDKQQGRVFTPGLFRNQRRALENLIELDLLILNYRGLSLDEATKPWQQLNLSFCCHSGYNPKKLRLLLLLDKPIPAGEYPKLREWAWQTSLGRLAERTVAADTAYPIAVCPPGRESEFRYNEYQGKALDWQTLIAEKPVSFMEEQTEHARKVLAWLKSLGQAEIKASYIYQYSPRPLKIRNKQATQEAMSVLERLGWVEHREQGRSVLWRLAA